MKKIATLLLTLLLALSLLSGCIQREFPVRRETKEAAKTQEPVETTETGETEETETEEPLTVDEAIHPLMWRVTKGDKTVYLFGTIHLGDDRNGEVLKLVKEKLLSCDALAVELDIVAEEASPQSTAEVLALYALTDGTTVRDHLSDELYRDAVAFLRAGGIDSLVLRQFDRFHPALWMQLVDEILSEQVLDLDYEKGMDRLLIQTAYENRIKVLEVEDTDAHYSVLLDLPDAYFEQQIRSLLDEQDEYAAQVHEMYEEWLAGEAAFVSDFVFEEKDEELLSPYLSEEEMNGLKNGKYSDTQILQLLLDRLPDDVLEQETEYTREELEMYLHYYEEMMDVRNEIMANQVQNYLRTYDNTFFAVGAAHMEGPGSVIDLLEQAGLSVEQIPIR